MLACRSKSTPFPDKTRAKWMNSSPVSLISHGSTSSLLMQPSRRLFFSWPLVTVAVERIASIEREKYIFLLFASCSVTKTERWWPACRGVTKTVILKSWESSESEMGKVRKVSQPLDCWGWVELPDRAPAVDTAFSRLLLNYCKWQYNFWEHLCICHLQVFTLTLIPLPTPSLPLAALLLRMLQCFQLIPSHYFLSQPLLIFNLLFFIFVRKFNLEN